VSVKTDSVAAIADDDPMRVRLLEATRVLVGQYGPRKLAMTDIATLAGVSRPTLYKHFTSKSELLAAFSVYQQRQFALGLAAASHGLTGTARLDAALRHVVDFQRDSPFHQLVEIEPGFMLEQLAEVLPTLRAGLAPLIAEHQRVTGAAGSARPADVADLIVRVALSHFLIPGRDRSQLLRELRYAAGVTHP
jgi:AcrR family transcriptional regulator